jgi:MtrB/PioB family decaheme-associated outer membrane protein
MTTNPSMRVSVLSAACLFLLWSPAFADQDSLDISNWNCKWCEFSYGWYSEIETGLGYVSDDSFRFGQYTGLANEGMFATVDGVTEYRGEDGRFWNFDIYALGSDRVSAAAAGGKQGLYDLYLTYDQLPYLIQDATVTPFSGQSTLRLPANWVRSDTTTGMTELDASLQPVSLETERRRLAIGGKFLPWKHWTMTLRFRSEEKDGRQSTGSPIGGLLIAQFPFATTSSVIQMPIDSETRSIDASVSYKAKKWRINFGYQGSFFDQKQESLVWQNPFNDPPGSIAAEGRTALAPDNEFHQFHSTIAYQLTNKTRATARLAIGRMSQNAQLLPYTINPGLQSALPQTTADLEVNTHNYQFKVSSRPVRKLSLNASFIYTDRVNSSKQSSYDYVVTDAALSPTPRINRTYDFSNGTFEVNGSYRFDRAARVSFGYKRKDIERTLQQIENSIEDSYWAAISYVPHTTMDLSLRYTDSDRAGDEFKLEPDTIPQQNPLIRKYNMADRERQALTGSISYTPNAVLGFGLSLDYADDDYTESQIGLTGSNSQTVTADVSISPTQQLQVYAFASHQDYESSQSGSRTFSTPTWIADTKDSFGTAGLTLKYQPNERRFSFNFDYMFSKSIGETEVADIIETSAPFPDLETQLHRVELYFNYEYSEKLSWRFAWLFEDFDSADWGRDGVDVSSIPTVLSLGEESFSYKIHVPVVSIQFKF